MKAVIIQRTLRAQEHSLEETPVPPTNPLRYYMPFSYHSIHEHIQLGFKTGKLRWTDQLTLLWGCSRTLHVWKSEIILLGCKPAFTLKHLWRASALVFFRHKKAFPFYYLVLEKFGTLLNFGDLKNESRWTAWRSHLSRKDGPCTCKYHLSAQTMREINKWGVNEVREKPGYLKARVPPVISRTPYA